MTNSIQPVVSRAKDWVFVRWDADRELIFRRLPQEDEADPWRLVGIRMARPHDYSLSVSLRAGGSELKRINDDDGLIMLELNDRFNDDDMEKLMKEFLDTYLPV